VASECYLGITAHKRVNPLKSLRKILRGEPLDWHLPHTLGPDERLARCARCSVIFIIHKDNLRVPQYCMGCK